MVSAATKVIRAIPARREQRVAMESLAPKGSLAKLVMRVQLVSPDMVARAALVPKVTPVLKVPKVLRAPRDFKVLSV